MTIDALALVAKLTRQARVHAQVMRGMSKRQKEAYARRAIGGHDIVFKIWGTDRSFILKGSALIDPRDAGSH